MAVSNTTLNVDVYRQDFMGLKLILRFYGGEEGRCGDGGEKERGERERGAGEGGEEREGFFQYVPYAFIYLHIPLYTSIYFQIAVYTFIYPHIPQNIPY